MRTVLHLRCSGGLYGAESVVLELAARSAACGYQSVLGVPHDLDEPLPELVSAARARGIETVPFPCRSRLDHHVFRDIRRFVRDRATDVIHTHGYREDLYARFAFAGVPLVATNHNWLRTTRALKVYAAVDALLLRTFNRVVGVSGPLIEEMAAKGIRPPRLVRIGNGVDVERCTASVEAGEAIRREYALTPDVTVFGIVGRVTREKGHFDALDALAAIARAGHKVALLVVGSGPDEESIRRRVAGREPRVCLLGHRGDVPALLQAMDIVLLPSYKEGLPMALLEAMAAGRPVIASAVGEIPAVVRDGESGLLVPPRDAEALRRACERLMADAEFTHSIGRAARTRVVDSFSSDVMARAYCALYDQCLTGNAATARVR